MTTPAQERAAQAVAAGHNLYSTNISRARIALTAALDEAEMAEAIDTAPPVEWCRRCRDLEVQPRPADFIVWGKLFPPESLGPRCGEHLDPDIRISRIDQYAVLDLRGLVRPECAARAVLDLVLGVDR